MELEARNESWEDFVGPWIMALALLALALGFAGCDEGGPESEPDASVPDDGSSVVDGSPELDAAVDALADAPVDAPDDVPVTITFRAKFGEQDFACGESFENVGASATTVQPVDLRFFVTDVVLVRADDGSEVPVELDVRDGVQNGTVALLDFEDATGWCGGSTGMNTIVTGVVPRGTYRGLAFSNGVPADLNHRNPIQLMAPLREGSMHWGWQGGFLFVNASVREALEEGEAGSATLHLGSTGCAGDPIDGYTCANPNRNRIVLPDFELDTDTVVFDVAELFRSAELTETTTCHSHGKDLCGAFFEAVGVGYATGEALETNAVYRVER